MLIGVPSEIKNQEHRVGLIPSGAHRLTEAGHDVMVQAGAGLGAGIPDEHFVAVGARIVETADQAWDAEMVIKVKEPVKPEWHRMREGQTLFTYLHLAADVPLTHELMNRRIQSVAYETVQNSDGSLPLLRPMSEVAGRLSVQAAAYSLQREHGGKGLLLGGVPGTRQANVMVLGGGVVGMHAARIAMGMGARVTILEVSPDRMNYIDDCFDGRIQTLWSTPHLIDMLLPQADVVIGAILIPGAKAPHLVTKEQVEHRMEEGSVVVDVAVDQGGCIETCLPTTHDDPTYIVGGVVHYCVANMPGAVSQTSTIALTNATLRHAVALADKGIVKACAEDPALALGVNVFDGDCTYKPVADVAGVDYVPFPG
jgi:alanine dehydrogenase